MVTVPWQASNVAIILLSKSSQILLTIEVLGIRNAPSAQKGDVKVLFALAETFFFDIIKREDF